MAVVTRRTRTHCRYLAYLGLYDGNPARLDPLPPEATAPRYLELMGGRAGVVAAARAAYDRGDYRWAAELLDRVLFAEPGDAEARELLARAYEQMGFVAEAATWRNSYLTAAAELRHGAPRTGIDRTRFLELLAHTPVERFLDAMAAALDGPAAAGKDLKINLVLTDTRQSHVLWIENAVLHHRAAPPADDADATLALTHVMFVRLVAGAAGAKDLLLSDDVKVTGSRVDLGRFFALLDKAPGTFAIALQDLRAVNDSPPPRRATSRCAREARSLPSSEARSCSPSCRPRPRPRRAAPPRALSPPPHPIPERMRSG